MCTHRILIANRGEIASRIISTARLMGLHTIAVYSEADRKAPFVQQAHEAHCLGPAEASRSYLDLDKIMEVAAETGTTMIHPGYGFLSENTALSLRCHATGIAFIGPPASAISAMGDKTTAKVLMEKAGVPLVPGYHGEDQDVDYLAQQAAEIGYPLMIKASAGGGGKGMRVVRNAAEFAPGLAGAKREAKNAFGNDHVLLERFVEAPRHVEVQVFFDQHGQGVYLFDRDCSIQRRHQKIIEEAPAPGLSPQLRQAMGEAAVRCGKAIDYVGAGTVEFLLAASGEFFFMEMNTRLQVEHPVTEAITGLDLVEWQIRVALGESLPWPQSSLRLQGHALEARIYAENPDEQFLPTSGHIYHLREPLNAPGIRVDTGIAEGLDVSPYYDPMLAKVIAHGVDRATAIQRLTAALESYELAGPVTNIGYMHRILSTSAFSNAQLRTDFVEQHREELESLRLQPDLQCLLGLTCWLASHGDAPAPGSPRDPWDTFTSWRLGPQDRQQAEIIHAGTSMKLAYCLQPEDNFHQYRAVFHTEEHTIQVRWQKDEEGTLAVYLPGHSPLKVRFVQQPPTGLTLFCRGQTWTVRVNHPELTDTNSDEANLSAPMHGRIIAVHVHAGDGVKAGEPLVVMEAMKMEHTLTAPADGRVTALHCHKEENVAAGQIILEFEPDDEGAHE